MAAVRVPVLPVLPETGKPGVTVDFPALPAPPMGDGRNGNREPSKVGAELFGLEQAKPRNHGCDCRKLPPTYASTYRARKVKQRLEKRRGPGISPKVGGRTGRNPDAVNPAQAHARACRTIRARTRHSPNG